MHPLAYVMGWSVTAAAMSGVLGLSGCGTTTEDIPIAAAIPGRTINGNVHGGVYPIRGATIKLMQTQTGPQASPGYTGTSTYGSAAKMLLETTSDQNGYFTFPDTGWTCAGNEFAYIVVTSGTTANLSTTNDNNNVVQVGVIGPCSDLANQADIDAVNVFVSELSTVAAAYALGNFITVVDPNDGTGDQVVNIGAPLNNSVTAACSGVGSAMKCTAAGLAHGFANAANIVNSVETNGTFPSGVAVSANPSSNVSAVPAAIINTIGNILQQCVDSTGVKSTNSSNATIYTASTSCSQLLTAATPPGGTAPTDTLEVALAMAKNPTNNVTGLYNLQAPAVPFTPTLEQAPTSFTVSIFYGATSSGSYVPYPVDLALDAADDAYVLYGSSGTLSTGSATGTENTYGAVAAIEADGAQLFYGAHNTSLLYPTQIAVSSTGTVYVTNDDTTTTTNGAIYKTTSSGTAGTLSRVASLTNASGIAVDQSNNVWASSENSITASLSEYKAATMAASTGAATADNYSKLLAVSISGLAVDAGQNIWGVSAGSSTADSDAVVFANTGSATTPAYASAGTGGVVQALSTYAGFGVALNSSSVAYFPLDDKMNSAVYAPSTITATGNPSLSTGSASDSAAVPHRTEVDGAGSVFWTDNEFSGLLYRYTPAASGNTGALISLLPCFPFPTSGGLQCITTNNSSSVYTPSNLRALAIDSAGDVWYAADAGYGTVIETLGLAAPTWPQLSYGHPGVMPK